MGPGVSVHRPFPSSTGGASGGLCLGVRPPRISPAHREPTWTSLMTPPDSDSQIPRPFHPHQSSQISIHLVPEHLPTPDLLFPHRTGASQRQTLGLFPLT